MSLVMKAELRWIPNRVAVRAPDQGRVAGYRDFVFRCALAVCGQAEQAEDVAQEVLLILLRKTRELEATSSPDGWIRKTTVRLAIRTLEREKRFRQSEAPGHAPTSISDQAAVYDVLTTLDPEDRALLGMAINQGLSYREIAEALSIPEGTVASRLNKAKKEFQKRWNG